MKGLLLKDFYMTVKYYKMSILMDIMFIAVSFLSKDNLSFLIFPVIISGVTPITLLGYDEKFKWTKYSGALPYSKAQIVSAKYLFGLIFQAVTALIVYIALIARINIIGGATILEASQMLGAMFVVSLIMPAFCLPFCFKFGTEKGRIMYFIFVFVLSAAIWRLVSQNGIPKEAEKLMWAIIPAIAIIYALSWLISIAVYGKREIKD